MNPLVPLSRAPVTREKVMRAEELMREHGTPVEIPVTHHFANKGTKHGLYAREIFIPKGTLLTGHIHKTEQVNFLLKGDISVLMEDGTIARLTEPRMVVSPAGTKRIAYTHEDTVWVTTHATDLSDLKLIEAEFIVHSEEEWLTFVRQLEHKEAA